MIQLKKVNKYFNRFKKNQIHVIDNTSIDFPDTGLIALLGPSGCGKTTLLNAIGGLDKINSGKIYINGTKIPKTSYFKDKKRTLNIGYIFQNYNLLDNMTVYDNVALSLKMIGIKNKKEIKEKVDYVLEQVDMIRFKNRRCDALSGGQRQRVAIARAIVKNPSVIIADEPTGNLDSKNTIEIMNIIKSISQSKLVILVTHEKELAEFYASRIITLVDGKVTDDKENKHNDELDYRIDNNLYLKDFKNHDLAYDNKYDINIYSDDDKQVKLDIVLKNGNIYIKSEDKIEVVDNSSSINFVHDHYQKIKQDDYTKSNFNLDNLKNNKKLKYASIYHLFSSIKAGIKRVFDYSFAKKILLLGFLMSAMFIVYALSTAFAALDIKDSDFVKVNKEYLYVESKKGDFDTYNKLIKHSKYVIPGDSLIRIEVLKNDLYQFNSDTKLSFTASLADKDVVKDVVYGKKAEKKDEIVIDKMIFDQASKGVFEMFGIGGLSFPSIGINSPKDMIGLKIGKNNLNYTIVGVSDNNSPSIYLDKSQFSNLLNIKDEEDYLDENNSIGDYLDYNLGKNLTLKKGHYPTKDYEVLVNYIHSEEMPLNKEIDKRINNKKLKVVGYYTTPYADDSFYVSPTMINTINILNNNGFTIFAESKEKALESLQNDGVKVRDTYAHAKNEHKKDLKDSVLGTFVISSILLLLSFIEIYLMIRASFMSRIKEIGIMRAIGVKKSDVYKMFAGEILVITTIAGIPGIIIMASLLKELKKISIAESVFMINPFVIITSLVLIYGFNLLVGLLPIWNVIRKTPAEVLARNDID